MPNVEQLPMLLPDTCYCHKIVRRELTADSMLKTHMRCLDVEELSPQRYHSPYYCLENRKQKNREIKRVFISWMQFNSNNNLISLIRGFSKFWHLD